MQLPHNKSISQWQTKKQPNYNLNFMHNLNLPKTNVILTLLKICFCKGSIDKVAVT